MAHRFARDRSEQVASVVSVSGWGQGACPDRPGLKVLQLHGDGDEVVSHRRGLERARAWADGLGAHEEASTTAQPLGAHRVTVRRWLGAAHRRVELWTVEGAGHALDPGRQVGERILGFLDR